MPGIGNRELEIGASSARAGWQFAADVMLPVVPIPYSRFPIPGPTIPGSARSHP